MRGHRGRRYPTGYFVPRNCWLCGAEITKHEDADFVIPGDSKGVCKDHHLKDILSVKSKYAKQNSRELKEYQNKGLQLQMQANTPKLKRKIKIIIKNKTPNKMRKFLINLFIFVVALEIIIHLPHILNVLINKIK